MQKKLKILFIPIPAVGHINSAIGMAQVLADSGHRIVFAINTQWKDKFKAYGFEEVLYTLEDSEQDVDPVRYMAEKLVEYDFFKKMTPLESAINLVSAIEKFDRQKEMDPQIETIIQQLEPDIILCDQIVSLPSVETSGIPWVLVCSCNPLFLIEDRRTPPGNSGLPAVGHETEWKHFRDCIIKAKQKGLSKINEYIISRGGQPLRSHLYINPSPYLNIYGYPLELDYIDLRPLPPNWHRFDNLKRTEKSAKFEIPVELREKPGKLVYFSMGSMCGANIQFMKRICSILSKSKHRFIVSKGPLHDRFELYDNMWGQSVVPQLDVLPVVDLVITHGGNNTVNETVFYGKPMIVIPFSADGFDNAQRIHEKGFGIKLDPYLYTEEQLLDSIEKLLTDKVLNEKLKFISKRIQTDNSIAELPELIEKVVLKNIDCNNNQQ